MANPRVVNLPAQSIDPDSSGLGAKLFDSMIAQPQAIAKEDAIEGIRAKYKAQAAQQANEFDQGMATLRSQLHMGETQAAWEHEQQLRQQEAQGFQTMVGAASGQGISLPGLTHEEGATPEAGIPGKQVPTPVNPNSLTEARALFAEGIKQHMGIKSEAEKEALHRTLGLTDSNDALQAEQLAQNFEETGDKTTAATIRAGYATPGLADHATWQKVQQDYQVKLQTSRATIASKLAIAKEITDRQLQVAQIRAAAQRAIAKGRIDDQGFKELSGIHASVQSNISRLTQMRNQMLQSQIMAPPEQAQQYQAEIDKIDASMKELNDMGANIRVKMEEWHNARNTGPTPSAAPTPITKPAGSPGSPTSQPTQWTRDASGKLIRK